MYMQKFRAWREGTVVNTVCILIVLYFVLQFNSIHFSALYEQPNHQLQIEPTKNK
jgi:hypothetical protein